MLRRICLRAACIAATAGVAVVTPLAAGAQEAPAVTTFAVRLNLDELVVQLDEAPAPVMPSAVAPFVDSPAFQLGLPDLANPDVEITNRFSNVKPDSCAARCNDLAARMAVNVGDDDVSVSVGATASVADRLGDFSSDDRPRWYLFVAADAQALNWGFNKEEHSSSVRLDDMRMLGDAQAGIGRSVGGGDLAIGYVSREVSHMGAERRENFVGLTFGWEG